MTHTAFSPPQTPISKGTPGRPRPEAGEAFGPHLGHTHPQVPTADDHRDHHHHYGNNNTTTARGSWGLAFIAVGPMGSEVRAGDGDQVRGVQRAGGEEGGEAAAAEAPAKPLSASGAPWGRLQRGTLSDVMKREPGPATDRSIDRLRGAMRARASSPRRGLRRLPGGQAAAAAAPRQLGLGWRQPAGGRGAQIAGARGVGVGGRRAGPGGAGSGGRAGRRAGGARGGPGGHPDEAVVDGEQHGGQRDAEEVGAHRGQAQPAAARALAQPRAPGALPAAAHAARAPHPRELGPRATPRPQATPPVGGLAPTPPPSLQPPTNHGRAAAQAPPTLGSGHAPAPNSSPFPQATDTCPPAGHLRGLKSPTLFLARAPS